MSQNSYFKSPITSLIVSTLACALCFLACVGPKESVDLAKERRRLLAYDPIERAHAALNLKKLGGRAAPAVPELIAILHDETPLEWQPGVEKTSPSEEAIKTLAAIGEPAVGPLIAALESNWDLIPWISTVLGRIGDPRAIEPLITALLEPRNDLDTTSIWVLKGRLTELRRDCARALGWIADSLPRQEFPGARRLIDGLESADHSIRRSSAEALGGLRDSRAVEPLIAMLKAPLPPSGEEGSEAYMRAEYEMTTRRFVVSALGDIGDKGAVDALSSVALDRNSVARDNAVYGLGKIRDISSVNTLFLVLQDESETLRSQAAEQLTWVKRGKPGHSEAVENLISALEHVKSEWVARSVSKTLSEITGKNFGPGPEKWRKWWNSRRPNK